MHSGMKAFDKGMYHNYVHASEKELRQEVECMKSSQIFQPRPFCFGEGSGEWGGGGMTEVEGGERGVIYICDAGNGGLDSQIY